jgi:Domain of Unknown Function (DUF1080)
MSSSPVRHPDDRLLAAFQFSKLDQRQLALVNKHLKECRECRQRLARLAAEMEIPAAAADTSLAPVPRARRRRANLLWLAAGALVAVVSVGIAWAVCAFSGGPGTATPAGGVARTEESQSKPAPPSSAVQPAETQPPVSLPPVTQPTETHSEPVATDAAKAVAVPPTVDAKPATASQSAKPVDLSTAASSSPASVDPPTPKPTVANGSSAAANSAESFFDGKDLAGWEGPAAVWRVEGGAIVGSLPTPRKQAVFLSTRKRYRDFDLMFRATVEGGVGDCAVQFRSQDRSNEHLPVSGPCCAIYGKEAPAEHRTSSLVIEPGHKLEKAPNAQRVERFVDPAENHFRIRCQGTHILIEVNGVKMVNGEFPSLPQEGIIAWKLDANRPPHKATFKILKFTDLSQAQPSESGARPSLADLELLRAEIKFEGAVKKADETLLNHFDPEIARLKRSSHAKEKDLVEAVEHEKDLFKAKGFVPWSRPMRKWLLQYGKELREAQRSIGAVFDAAIERAEKSHNETLKEALIAEAAQILVPREVACWELTDRDRAVRRSFFSDGTFMELNSKAKGESQDESSSRFWSPPVDDILVLEFPDPKEPTATNQQAYEVAADGKTLATQNSKGQRRVWQRVDEPGDDEAKKQ